MSEAALPTDLWAPLSPTHRRVLGVLIEKQKTSKSADAYPMTLNSLVTGCNQKSNRDPVTEYSDDDVEEALGELQKLGLTLKVTGSRVDRYRHLLYEGWRVSKLEMAVLAELLLRGPQTEGDLRGRASRMDEIADLDALRGILKGLVERKMVVYLLPPERRGTVLTHGFHTPAELERARAAAGTGAVESAPRATGDSRLAELQAENARLKETVARLERELAEYRTGERGA